jgi:hypothetical protein
MQAGDQADERCQGTPCWWWPAAQLRSDGQAYCELTHDYLATAVSAPERKKSVQAGVNCCARNGQWRLVKQLVPLETLKLIDARRDDLQHLSGKN